MSGEENGQMEQNVQELDQGFELDTEKTENGADRTNEDGLKREAEESGQQEGLPDSIPQQAVEQASDNASPESVQEKPRLEKTPENIATELEDLKRLSPEAAQLAMEDSPDGAAIRKRLETYGAEYAQDKAESVLEKRQERFRQEQAQKAQIDAHNRNFMETIRKRNPEYFDLISNEKRRDEAQRYFKGVFSWIESLPFREAKTLMETAQNGKDPNQICDLVERYEKEKGRPDPTGGFAVTGRGASFVGGGIGDRNDMDAGWNLNRD